jgi:hypothetical protein
MITLKRVNDAIKSETSQYIDLYKGEGYFYFVYDDGKRYSTTSVYVNGINQLTLESWLYEGKAFWATLKAIDRTKNNLSG